MYYWYNVNMQLAANEIQIWTADLSLTPDQEKECLSCLSAEEKERALRFRLPLHTTRFIASHSFLRQIIGKYLNIAPEIIDFDYTKNQKPFLRRDQARRLQFNLSHSGNLCVIALTLDVPVGIDIEKIQETYKQPVAERFFSHRENAELAALTEQERTAAFYRIWARKETLIKAVGKGLSIPLTSFSVHAANIPELVELEDETWQLLPLNIAPGYESAVATRPPVKKLSVWSLIEQKPVPLQVQNY